MGELGGRPHCKTCRLNKPSGEYAWNHESYDGVRVSWSTLPRPGGGSRDQSRRSFGVSGFHTDDFQ